MRRHTLLLAVPFMLAACADSPPNQLAADTAVNAEAAAKPAVIKVSTKDFAFDMPASIEAGTVTLELTNQGPEPHHMELVRLEQGKTFDDLMRAMQTPAAGWPEWAVEVGGPNAAMPGASVNATMTLQAGNYAVLCFVPSADGKPHVMKGMARPITVTPSSKAVVPLPPADLVMKLSDYKFDLSSPITAGRRVIRLENGAQQGHEVLIVKLNPGKTPMDFVNFVEKHQGELPGIAMGGITGLTPGQVTQITVDFEPGEYGLICFFPDKTDGKPHLAHGMIKQFTVS